MRSRCLEGDFFKFFGIECYYVARLVGREIPHLYFDLYGLRFLQHFVKHDMYLCEENL
jgi:hypothetical protein